MRAIVSQAFEARIAQGLSAPAALAEPICQECYGQRLPIGKVRCYTPFFADETEEVFHPNPKEGPHKKVLRQAGYAYMEISTDSAGVPSIRLVGIREGMKNKGRPQTSVTERYYKGDVIEDTTTGIRYVIKKFAASDGKIPRPTIIALRHTEAVSDVSKVKQSGGRYDFFKERLLTIRHAKQQ